MFKGQEKQILLGLPSKIRGVHAVVEHVDTRDLTQDQVAQRHDEAVPGWKEENKSRLIKDSRTKNLKWIFVPWVSHRRNTKTCFSIVKCHQCTVSSSDHVVPQCEGPCEDGQRVKCWTCWAAEAPRMCHCGGVKTTNPFQQETRAQARGTNLLQSRSQSELTSIPPAAETLRALSERLNTNNNGAELRRRGDTSPLDCKTMDL